MNGPAEAEKVQHTVYLSSDRNWTSEKGDNSFYEDKVFFLEDGRIGINRGGRVIIRTIEHWASSAKEMEELRNMSISDIPAGESREVLVKWHNKGRVKPKLHLDDDDDQEAPNE